MTPSFWYQPPLVQSHVHRHGTMHTRCGGREMAAVHWVMPLYDTPYMPTLPFDHG